MHFITSIKEHNVAIDLSKENGGNHLATSPKIVMLVSLAGCTGVDVVAILNKMRADFSDFSINVHAHLTETDAKIYDEVMLTYTIKIDEKDESKVEKALTLSQDKYCGVSEMFRSFAKLSHKIEFIK